jgi:hypothetical protein
MNNTQNGDKNIVSLLPPKDAKQVLLALFSEDNDLPEMTPLANIAYTSITGKGVKVIYAKPATIVRHDVEDSQEERFDAFWSAYPRKIGKEAARKAWRRIKPTEDHQRKIIAAIEKAKNCSQWQKDNGLYIPNPATWLNQGRWDDEIPQNSTGWKNNYLRRTRDHREREYNDEYLERFVNVTLD